MYNTMSTIKNTVLLPELDFRLIISKYPRQFGTTTAIAMMIDPKKDIYVTQNKVSFDEFIRLRNKYLENDKIMYNILRSDVNNLRGMPFKNNTIVWYDSIQLGSELNRKIEDMEKLLFNYTSILHIVM